MKNVFFVFFVYVGIALLMAPQAIATSADSIKFEQEPFLEDLKGYESYKDKFENPPSVTNDSEANYSENCIDHNRCEWDLKQRYHRTENGGVASLLGDCEKYLEIQNPKNYDFDERDPANLRKTYSKLKDEVRAARCEAFFEGFYETLKMDYVIRGQNDMQPPFSCRLYTPEFYIKEFLDIFASKDPSEYGRTRSLYTILKDNNTLCDEPKAKQGGESE